jgi:DNA-binding IscR family transcriptional regulator
LSKALQEATIAQLSQALAEAINSIQFAQYEELRKNPTSETNQALLEAQDALNTFLAKLDVNE